MALGDRDLRLYGAASDKASLAWPWVEQQLADAGTYWIDARTPGHPHPRPVWGVWSLQQLHLSIGSPNLRLAVREEPGPVRDSFQSTGCWTFDELVGEPRLAGDAVTALGIVQGAPGWI